MSYTRRLLTLLVSGALLTLAVGTPLSAQDDWARQPMAELTTVTVSVNAGSNEIALNTDDLRICRITKPRRVFGDDIEHRLNVSRRACNHPQYLARRSLLLQRLGDLPIALFELIEQANVFDCDNRLVSEGLQEFHLRRCKRMHLAATCIHYANEISLLTKRNQ